MFGYAISPAAELVRIIDPPRPPWIRCGTAALQVCQTPVRLTSIMSCHSWSDSPTVPSAVLAIPAFAATMSSRPSWATPSSTAARSAAPSRTSVSDATIRRSSASTCLTVSARSSDVDIGYGTESICLHRSTAMMSAPSSASRIAWLRPWPRAAPVTNATLPSTRPIASPSLRREAGVDGQRHPGHVAGLVGDEPEDRVADVDRLDQFDRQQVGHRPGHGRILLQEPLHHLVDHHRGVHAGGVHRVDPDVVLGEVRRVRAHEADHAVLAGGVAEAAAGLAADALEPGGRAGQHDRPAAALLDQPRHGHLDGVPDAGEVDVDDVSPGRDPVLVLRAHRAMPALASTMSTPPSCATPSSRTALSAAWSRTSACLATIRRSSASTSLTVSARSSGVAIGYSTVGICSHRSTAMMSAPSWASRIAWLRPWPRAAPVTKATFPSTRPICSLPP